MINKTNNLISCEDFKESGVIGRSQDIGMGLLRESPERGLDLGAGAGLRDPEHLIGALPAELLAAVHHRR